MLGMKRLHPWGCLPGHLEGESASGMNQGRPKAASTSLARQDDVQRWWGMTVALAAWEQAGRSPAGSGLQHAHAYCHKAGWLVTRGLAGGVPARALAAGMGRSPPRAPQAGPVRTGTRPPVWEGGVCPRAAACTAACAGDRPAVGSGMQPPGPC